MVGMKCTDVMDFCRDYRGEKFHALLCDPPYELGFMGKKWDRCGIAFDPGTWAALAEHLHPGAFGMAFASSRGWHRLACAIEDAGLRIHPSIFGWVSGSGFPKATRIDTQIDKAAGAVGTPGNYVPNMKNAVYGDAMGGGRSTTSYQPATSLAKAWAGHRYGLQAMKPALEPIIVFQKPYEGKPVESIVETGAGALRIDGARIPTEDKWHGADCDSGPSVALSGGACGSLNNMRSASDPEGRWPANFYLDGTARRLGEQSGKLTSGADPTRRGPDKFRSTYQPYGGQRECVARRGANSGTAARFFFNVNRQIDEADPVMYCAKASRKERDAGLAEVGLTGFNASPREYDGSVHGEVRVRNPHPTVKPIDLTRWLATLLLPPSEYLPRRILVPFAGSGAEMIGAHLAGWEEVVGIEREAEYVEIAEARIDHWCNRAEQLQLTM